MDLDPARCYAALASRDRRFDGRFFTGVATTGIYCRPICPARTPKRANVRFFACAAAAEAAGFRACRRCRPETAPGTPAWRGTSATVARALREIERGALDRDDVEALAASLGVGARHLRRLFLRHLGASPRAVAGTRRVHFARRLLDETDLPVTEVAFAAGFRSLRRFHAAVAETFGAPPRALRRRRGTCAPGELVLRLAFRPPFDAEALLAFLAARAIPGVELVEDGTYRRSFAVEGVRSVLAVRARRGETHLRLEVPGAASRPLAALVERVRRLFDLDADPAAVAAVLGRDPAMAERVRARPGLRVPGAFDGFELAVRAILGQQVSVAAATTLAGRLARAFGEPLADPPHPGLARLFPAPEVLAEAPVERIGMPAARARAVRALAAEVAKGRLVLAAPGDAEAARARLRALPGVGAWTAEYVALRALGDPDALPAGDLGLRRALARGGRPVGARGLSRRAEAWRPFRSYAAVHLWAGAPPGMGTRAARSLA